MDKVGITNQKIFTERYIKMCIAAYGMQEAKYQKGFFEGDWIYIGKWIPPAVCEPIIEKDKIRVIGHDFLPVDKRIIRLNHEFNFLVETDLDPVTIETDDMCEVKVKTGRYVLETFQNPIWLPLAHDLWEMIRTFYYLTVGYPTNWKLDILQQMNEWIKQGYNFETLEELLLAFLMEIDPDWKKIMM